MYWSSIVIYDHSSLTRRSFLESQERGNVIPDRPESVLVGHVLYGVHHAVVAHVGVGAPLHLHRIGGGGREAQEALFATAHAISRHISAREKDERLLHLLLKIPYS